MAAMGLLVKLMNSTVVAIMKGEVRASINHIIYTLYAPCIHPVYTLYTPLQPYIHLYTPVIRVYTPIYTSYTPNTPLLTPYIPPYIHLKTTY